MIFSDVMIQLRDRIDKFSVGGYIAGFILRAIRESDPIYLFHDVDSILKIKVT